MGASQIQIIYALMNCHSMFSELGNDPTKYYGIGYSRIPIQYAKHLKRADDIENIAVL